MRNGAQHDEAMSDSYATRRNEPTNVDDNDEWWPGPGSRGVRLHEYS